MAVKRLILLVETIFIQQYFCTTTLENTGQLEVHSYHDQRLLGECYHNITTSLMQECLQHCLSDCLCKSFQICGGTCQLCSNTGKFQAKIKSKSLGCNRFEFEKWKILNLNAQKDQCESCITGINCCLTSQPCLNNGVCIPSFTNNTRFICKCVDGYTGHRCSEKPTSSPSPTPAPTPPQKPKSCHGFLSTNQGAGQYDIFDNNNKKYPVQCSFDSNMAWTLVQSYEYSQRGGFVKPLYQDDAKNEDTPSWTYYRLSLSRMKSIQKDSNPKWRLTCNFDTDSSVSTDYVIATHADVPLLPSNSKHAGCKNVESIDIRGHSCSNCKVMVAHAESWGVHLDSYYSGKACLNNFPGSKDCGGSGEDNFGYYGCRNTEHRCSSTERSTTQLWFGGAKT